MPLRHRAAFSKFRCEVATLRIEKGRFENIPLEERKCPFCDNVESEQHVLLYCCMYDDLRDDLFCRASNIESCLNSFSIEHKTVFLFSNQSMTRIVAKTCSDILQGRASYMCKS